MRVYEEAAAAVHIAGLNPLPTKPDEKSPGVKWMPFQTKRIPRHVVDKWRACATLGARNIGTTTGGVTGLLLVDVDSTDASFWDDCITRWGDTPAKVRTASGKLHLWYRSPGGVRNAQRIDGTPVDLRGDGGFAVLPPSVRDGIGDYTWLEGSLEALQRLPLPRPGSLPSPATTPPAAILEAPSKAPRSRSGIERGERNTALFKHLLSVARDYQSDSDLVAEATRWNADLAEPEPLQNVLRTAHSVWGYKINGTLLVPGSEPAVLLPVSVVDDLAAASPYAHSLYVLLRRKHAGRHDVFPVPVRALAAEFSWAERTIRAARQTLLDRGLLVQVHAGGARDGDVSRFRFGANNAA